MIDIHSHLVYDVDDGSQNIEETLHMINEAYNAGFTDIILTPHYMQNFYIKESMEISNKIDNIKDHIKNLKINLYHGNEIYANENLINFIKEKKAVSLAGSKYILFELPIQENPLNLEEIVYVILENGYIPIIAHPERYRYVQENPNMLIYYIESGVLFQANYGSIIGLYGTKTKETVKKLLSHNMIHFLGSDNHFPNSIYKKMPEILISLKKIIGEEKLEEISTINPSKILKNEIIDIDPPTSIKKGFLGLF